MQLKNKVIIVTGGSGLIGKEIVATINNSNGIAINADIAVETDLNKRTIHCDITNPSSIQFAINLVVEKYGRLDGLVNNAYPRTKDWGNRFEDIEFESWQKNIDSQLNSCFVFCQKALAVMKEQGGGSIVNIASIYGVISPDFTTYEGTNLTSPAAYTAIKGGIVNFTRFLAAYFGNHNIRINCVSPGGIYDGQNPVFVKNYEHKVPMKRMGRANEISKPVAFLLSDGASYITGHNLIVDGGWTSI